MAMLENYVKFLRGTPSQYKALTEKDKDTLYFISEKNSNYGTLYLGTKIIADGGEPETITLDSLKGVSINGTTLEDSSLLVYDEASDSWINQPLEEILQAVVNQMTGATTNLDGKSGLVPKPLAGQQDHFLKGDGTWAKITTKTQIFEVSPMQEETHMQAIVRTVGNSQLNIGDISIIKELIINDKYQYTAYVYDSEWKAMDGNYNAENVYFDEDLLTTSTIGVIELENGQATIPAAGKNLKEVFNTIFVKEQNPETVNPSVLVSLTKTGDFEVGTKVPINYTITFNDGSYSYGPEPTGVTISSCIVSDGNSTINFQNGSFDDLLISDETNYRLTATITHTEGKTPITNLGNKYPEGIIKTNSVIEYSNYIKGFRPFFYGMSDINKDELIYDSNLIRGLTNGGAYDESKILTFTAAELNGVKRFIIAIPMSSITELRKGIESAVITSSMNVDVLDFYEELKDEVYVEGANGYLVTVPYKVWVYEPQSIAKEEVHKVVLK